jgi:hypothetical protein
MTPSLAFADVTCPIAIEVTQRLAAPQDGWTEGVDAVLPTELASLAVFDGRPEERAQLIHDDEQATSETSTIGWDLPPNPRGYWITCQYANTTVTLTRALPQSATRCEVVFDLNVRFGPGSPVVLSMSCGPSAE